ncbi:tail assembly chaperone [Vibrio phage 11895-B1]|uniref:tail assembly chaperone n=1 Tax=Vibrio phage 11895-B1 TaxID=754075 RepID=UPI0002C0A100|nr:tail assembly chaperone [Vibrio phage 11895-B1]AGH32173.1 hypothetical protein VPHG_00106 [Vibrio phage 11895-B1]
MFKLSKNNTVKKEINGRVYKLRTWSAFTTGLEGFKLAKVFAPALAMGYDLHSVKSEEQKELEAIYPEIGDQIFTATGVVTQLTSQLTDEHFMDLSEKLFSGLSYLDEEGEAHAIDNADEYLESRPNDYIDIMVWSLKENLWDFFMKQDMFASKIGAVAQFLTKTMESLNSLNENNETE